MSANSKLLIPLRGSEAYGKALERLRKAVEKEGMWKCETVSQLAELALAEMGVRYGVRMPKRSDPVGTNRFGKPAQKNPE